MRRAVMFSAVVFSAVLSRAVSFRAVSCRAVSFRAWIVVLCASLMALNGVAQALCSEPAVAGSWEAIFSETVSWETSGEAESSEAESSEAESSEAESSEAESSEAESSEAESSEAESSTAVSFEAGAEHPAHIHIAQVHLASGAGGSEDGHAGGTPTDGRTGDVLEVALRVLPEDLEAALNAGTEPTLRLEDPAAEARLRTYLTRTVSATDRAGHPQAPRWVGWELSHAGAWIYFELPVPGGPAGVRITNRFLMELPDTEASIWNLRLGETRHALVFTREHPERTIPEHPIFERRRARL